MVCSLVILLLRADACGEIVAVASPLGALASEQATEIVYDRVANPRSGFNLCMSACVLRSKSVPSSLPGIYFTDPSAAVLFEVGRSTLDVQRSSELCLGASSL